MDNLENGLVDPLAVLILPEKYRKRERVIRIFPNEDSAIRLIGVLLAEQHETWSTGRCYLNITDFVEWEEEWKRKNDNNSDLARLKVMPV